MKAPQVPRWALTALVGLLLVGLAGWMMRMRQGVTVALADGRGVEVLAVSYGTNHHLALGRPWIRAVRRFLSPGRAYQLGLRSFDLQTRTPAMTVWTRWHEFPTNPAPRLLTVVDRHGVESEPILGAMEDRDPAAGTVISAWSIQNYPRTQREVWVRLYQPDSSYHLHRVAELPVRNPRRATVGEVPYPAPPIVVSRGAVDYSLLSLATGEPPPVTLRGPSFDLAPWTTLRLGIRELGEWNAEWSLLRVEGSSPAGNHFARVFPPTRPMDHELVVWFQEVLWADDRDWQLRVELLRTGGFAATALWTSPPLPPWQRAQPFVTNLLQTADGVSIQSLQLAVHTGLVRREPRGYRRNTDMTLLFTNAAPPRLYAVLTRLVDERGRELRFGPGREEAPGKFVAGLDVPAESRSVAMTFAFQTNEVLVFKAGVGLR